MRGCPPQLCSPAFIPGCSVKWGSSRTHTPSRQPKKKTSTVYGSCGAHEHNRASSPLSACVDPRLWSYRDRH
eukprot:6207177-Pleurochrysis_carterae.AAC.3